MGLWYLHIKHTDTIFDTFKAFQFELWKVQWHSMHTTQNNRNAYMHEDDGLLHGVLGSQEHGY